MMATFRSIEEIDAWQKARELAKAIYAVTRKGTFSKDFGLRDQIQRASVSVMSNVAEGYERDGTKEFIQFLSIAKGSAGEVKSHLYVARDQGYLNKDEFVALAELTDETRRLIAGFISYLKQSSIKGAKF
ncbi:MAG: four helix bundle protein [Candidatus Neomarinimicrobiota bacterium]